jgi:predicted ATPase
VLAHQRTRAEYDLFLQLVEQILGIQLLSPASDHDFRFRNVGASEELIPADWLSTGQQSAIYLILRVLAAAKGATIVIDEPEVHLNPALVIRHASLLCLLQRELNRESGN